MADRRIANEWQAYQVGQDESRITSYSCSSDSKFVADKGATYKQAITLGCKVRGTYEDTQLVALEDLYYQGTYTTSTRNCTCDSSYCSCQSVCTCQLYCNTYVSSVCSCNSVKEYGGTHLTCDCVSANSRYCTCKFICSGYSTDRDCSTNCSGAYCYRVNCTCYVNNNCPSYTSSSCIMKTYTCTCKQVSCTGYESECSIQTCTCYAQTCTSHLGRCPTECGSYCVLNADCSSDTCHPYCASYCSCNKNACTCYINCPTNDYNSSHCYCNKECTCNQVTAACTTNCTCNSYYEYSRDCTCQAQQCMSAYGTKCTCDSSYCSCQTHYTYTSHTYEDDLGVGFIYDTCICDSISCTAFNCELINTN